MVRTFKISVSNFLISNTVLLITITILYTRFPKLIHLVSGGLCSLANNIDTWFLKFIVETPITLSISQSLSCSVTSDSGTPWTIDHQTPLSMEFSRQEYWSGLPFPSAGDLLNPGIKPMSLESPALQVDSFPLTHWASPNLVYILTQILSKFLYFIVALSLKVIRLHIFSHLKDDWSFEGSHYVIASD